MIFHPILPVWALLILLIFAIGLWAFAFRARRKGKDIMWWLRLIVILLLAAMSLRPSVPGGIGATGTQMVDVYLVVDNTFSMRAEDYDGTKQRIEGVRADAKEIMEHFAGARFTLITFDNQARVVTPLVSDASAVSTELEVMSPPYSFDGTGTNIDAPLDILVEQLESDEKISPDRSRIVIFMSDGENTNDKTAKSYEPIAKLIQGGAVLGYGTSQGGRMKNDTSYDSNGDTYVKQGSSDALSKIDEDALNKIATDTKMTYSHRTKADNLSAVYEQANFSTVIEQSRDIDSYTDIYWVAAPILVGYYAVELSIVGAYLARARRAQKRGNL